MAKSPNQQLWDKEVKRIERQVAKLARQGIAISLPVPPKPKRVTAKQLNRLRSLLPEATGKKPRPLKTTAYEPQKGHRLSTGARTPSPRPPAEPYVRHPRTRKERVYVPHPLTHEERVEIAKRAAATRKKFLAEHPDIAEAERQKRAERLAQTRAKMAQMIAEDPEYAKRIHAKRSEAAKKAAATRISKGIVPFQRKPVPQREPEPYVPDEEWEDISDIRQPSEDEEYIPDEVSMVLDELKALIASADMENVAGIVGDVLAFEIDQYGEEEVARRLQYAGDEVLDLAQKALFYHKNESIEDMLSQAFSLLYIICDGEPKVQADVLMDSVLGDVKANSKMAR